MIAQVVTLPVKEVMSSQHRPVIPAFMLVSGLLCNCVKDIYIFDYLVHVYLLQYSVKVCIKSYFILRYVLSKDYCNRVLKIEFFLDI